MILSGNISQRRHMPPLPEVGQPRGRHGFALVVALALMSFVLLLLSYKLAGDEHRVFLKMRSPRNQLSLDESLTHHRSGVT